MTDIHLVQNGKIYLKVPYDEKEMIKQVPGRRWNNKTKLWSVPYDEDTVELVNSMFGTYIPRPIIDRAAPADRQPATNLILSNLYQHQKQSISVARRTKCFADLSEPGTGKTLVQIELMLERNEWPVLVVCPKSIMEPVWLKQLLDILPPNCLIPFILNNGSKNVKKELNDFNNDPNVERSHCIVIINYEMVPLVIDELLQIEWKSVILDESTKIKNHTRKRSKAVMKLRDVNYRSIMTGTLAPNGLEDAFNQFKFVQPKIFGEAFYAFRHRYFTPGGYMNYGWFPKPDAMDNFKRKIKGISCQHFKRECMDLPPLVEEIRKVEMSVEQSKAYNSMRDELIVWLNEDEAVTAPFIITKIIKLMQLANGFLYHDDKIATFKHSKIDELLQLLDQLGNSQVIIFAHFKYSQQSILDVLKNKKITTSYFGHKVNERNKAIEDFIEGKTRIFLASTVSAQHGINLQNCHNIIYMEHDFSLETYLQSMQRIERIGQKNKMTIFHLLTENSIESYVLKKLRMKQDLNRALDINELKEAL